MKLLLYLILLVPFIAGAQTISIIALDSTTICNGRTARFVATVTGDTSPHYQWQVNRVSVGTDSAAFSTNSLRNGDSVRCVLTNFTHTAYWATSSSLFITVQNTPHAGVITGAETFVCVGATTLLSDTSTGGFWATASSHCSVNNGLVTGGRDGGFECSWPYYDTVFYIVSNSCGADTARYRIMIHAMPHAYFELRDGFSGYTYSISAVTCSPPVPYAYPYGLKPVSGFTDFMCEGVIHAKHDFVDASIGAVHGVKPGVDTVVNVSTNICGTSTFEMQVTVVGHPGTPMITKSIEKLCVGERDSIVAGGSSSCFSPTGASVQYKNNVAYVMRGRGGRAQGFDTVILRATNQCGSTDTSISIEIKNTPALISGKDSVCAGYPIALFDSINGGAWSSFNSSVAEVNASNGTVSGIADGIATISYSLLNGCSVSKGIVINTCEKEIELYPNPCRDEVTVHLFVDIYHSCKVYNILGQVVGESAIKSDYVTLNMLPLPKGIYVLKLAGELNTTSRMLVKE